MSLKWLGSGVPTTAPPSGSRKRKWPTPFLSDEELMALPVLKPTGKRMQQTDMSGVWVYIRKNKIKGRWIQAAHDVNKNVVVGRCGGCEVVFGSVSDRFFTVLSGLLCAIGVCCG